MIFHIMISTINHAVHYLPQTRDNMDIKELLQLSYCGTVISLFVAAALIRICSSFFKGEF